ncbi:MAG: TauD/TfdA family dioxygenase [Pseudomonadales bacterium]|jgi:taurine dioxygenase|tara:strand:+ start:21141 stop:21983 length:843 start_codon:yes stop_codon:yes gene_type:complete
MIIRPLTGLIGAEITGLDMNDLDEVSLAELDRAFAKHLVLCVRDQSLSPSDLVNITNRLGGPGDTPYLTGLKEYPDVVPVVKEADENSPHTFGAGWHTDFTFQERPPAKTLLYAVDTPVAGGDTLYANLYAAYDALSEGMKTALKSLNAVHSATKSYGPQATLKNHLENMTIINDDQEPDTQIHPVICMHPVTKRPALWINPTYTIRFENMTQEESLPLLDYLNQLIVNPRFCCRVRWEPGTLTLWDNRCTQHCATSDYQGYRREMWRTTVAGQAPIAFA